MISNQKRLFNIPDDVTYLNCAYMGPQLKSVSEVGKISITKKEHPWDITMPDFYEPPEKLKSLYAKIVNADKNSIALIPSVSYGIETAVKNIQINKGANIVVLAEQFPSNIYSWIEVVKRTEAQLITIERPVDKDWTSVIISTINNKTDVVALPQAHWTDGSFIDLVQVRHRCDEVNAALVVDATQSVGACPFDVQKIKPDFLISAAYKWLLGPYSITYMYVDPKYHTGKPLEFGWMSRKGSEDFSGLVNYTDELQEGASRFDVGEKSNFALVPMAINALEQILDWGVENIYSTLSKFTSYAEEEATKLGLSVTPIPKRAGHLMGLRFSSGVPNNLIQKLKCEKISVSVRGSSIRVAPHLYNDKSDFDHLFEVIKYQIKNE
ncbi:MAG: aminotransferase class V-fold PLP-dependent enzyme [Calditrichaeota bacterium]|nr:MAG: aminotransferase class V-fold PLP-dependent enzyme [Calditrichota bacterium]MBL1204635.1 aminotransferase class V-fold PLP-dependent enzyme [Calditrichota bacterium]NOG44463.1 aminotransferase class V-fold PLP-dependent enzyme [Calditrichota bacterium]